jgi:hypothetical protein
MHFMHIFHKCEELPVTQFGVYIKSLKTVFVSCLCFLLFFSSSLLLPPFMLSSLLPVFPSFFLYEPKHDMLTPTNNEY